MQLIHPYIFLLKTLFDCIKLRALRGPYPEEGVPTLAGFVTNDICAAFEGLKQNEKKTN